MSRFPPPPAGKPHIRRKGEDEQAGTTVLTASARLGPGQLALLAALQLATVPVLRPCTWRFCPRGMSCGKVPIHLGRDASSTPTVR